MKILIICNYQVYNDTMNENGLYSGALGGSETWAIQLAEAFVRKNAEVTLVCPTPSHLSVKGVLYINNTELGSLLKYHKFDLVIISRVVGNLLEIIDENKTSDNVFIQAHDVALYNYNINPTDYKCFKGVSTLSAFHEKCLHDYHGIAWENMVRTGNGIDPKLFQNMDMTPTNRRLLYSSEYKRGGSLLHDVIAPRIPDSGVDFAFSSYAINEEVLDIINNNEYSKFIGCLAKIDLYREMSQRYCWVYPTWFPETFCITLLENIMCENDIITYAKFGMASVIEPFVNDISLKHSFYGTEEEFDLALDETVDRINESLDNHEKGQELRMELKNYVLTNYTWDKIADKWLKLI